MTEKIREIIDQVVADCIVITNTRFTLEDKKKQAGDKVYTATLAIKQVFLEMLPEEYKINPYKLNDVRNQGYNQCLAEIKAKLEGR